MSTATYTYTSLTPELADAIGLIGKTVTVGDQQYYVHSIEGADWYVFRNETGMVVVDQGLTASHFITTPIATLIPFGSKLGEGASSYRPIDQLKRGVCLSKSYR